MKPLLFLSAFLFFITSISFSQNVGIGTSAPTGKLQINQRSTGDAGLLMVDSAANGVGKIRFRQLNRTVGMTMGGYSGSNFNADNYLDYYSDSAFIATFRGDGTVGIRNGSPAYPLDVNGDINTTGALRVAGNAGTDGQVLQSNGNGLMSWEDKNDFKNFVVFTNGTFASWTIPTGTKKFMVELWGGGAAGTPYIGGGGGGYLLAIVPVDNPSAPGSLTYTVGDAGTGGNGADGTASNLFYATISLQANGGYGGTFTAGTPQVIGEAFGGEGSASPATFRSYIVKRGSSGQSYYSSIQTAGSVIYETVNSGRGGNAGNTGTTGGSSNQLVVNLTTNTALRWSNAVGNGIVPGGGGSSGVTSFNASIFSSFGSNGANGLVIVHY